MPYHYSPERLAALKRMIKDQTTKGDPKKSFANVYHTLTLKEATEYYGIKPEDVYILVHSWGIPMKLPKLSEALTGRTVNRVAPGSHKPKTQRRFGHKRSNKTSFTRSGRLDYDRLAALVAESMIRLIVKGWVAQQRATDNKKGKKR